MNEKKQDQLIRETFDQYRAGISSMPSQRAQIIYKLGEKPAANTRLYYRIAAVAAALVLLLGIGLPVLSGNGLLTGHPDQVRTTGDLAAVRPEPTGFVPLAQPEGTPETAVQPEPEESGSSFQQEVRLNYHTWMDSVNRDLVDALAPVNLSYEKSGIRLNVLQGAVTETEALLVYSVEDLIGGRFNEHTYNPVYPAIGSFDSFDNVLAEYDEAGNRYTYGIHVRYKDLAHCLDGPVFPLSMQYLDVTEYKTAVFTANPESSESPALVAMPEQADWYVENTEKPNLMVMDYSSPQDVPLGKHVRLSQAGVVDGQFRVQFRYVDNGPIPLREDSEYVPFVDVAVSLENQPGWDQHFRWDADGDEVTDFEEFVFTLNGKPAGALKYQVDIIETARVLNDGWNVDIPLSSVWKGEASYSEISRRIERKNIPDYVSENYPQFNDCLVPVNLSCEKSGIRLDVLYGAAQENEALLIYSVQDTEGDRINELTVDPVFPGMTGYDSYSGVLHEYDAENHRITAGMVIRYDDLESCLEESAIPLDMTYLEVCSKATAEYEQPRREVIIPGLVQLPELMDYCIRSDSDGKREYYTTEDYRALGRKVIDYSLPGGHPVSDHVLLSHAEAYGSEFHVQLQYTDWAYWPLRDAKVVLLDKEGHETTPGWDGHMRWDTDNDGDPDFEEFVFPIDPKGTGPIRFRVDIIETREVLEDSWEVKIPLESIRKEQGEVTAE